MKKVKSEKKAVFFQRLIAFIIDLMIVSILASIISIPFIDSKKIDDLNEKSVDLVEKYSNKKVNTNEYVAEYINISYDLARESGPITIIELLVGISLYIILPLYYNGQTIGKKILKIRIKSDVGELTSNQLIFRAFIANSMLVNIISLFLMIFSSREIYFYCVGLFLLIQYIITFISIIMVMYTKNGLAIHDKLVHTRVVKC